MSIKGLGLCLSFSMLLLTSALPRQATGEPPPATPAGTSGHGPAGEHRRHAGELVKLVREVTSRFRDIGVAKGEGYELHFGCVSDEDDGAMGLHYVNMALVGDGVLDARQPEIVIYEPLPNGGRRLIGADYLVLADAWHANNAGPPQLMGQLFHLFESPNRFGLPAFYTLHVWAWKPNANGAFVNWHPDVGCEAFDGEEH
jgi:hypothetical protein